MPAFANPPPDCPRCPRLAAFRQANRAALPEFHNAPVAAFGGLDARLLVVGLAPGLRGANRTGRPFTGDYAGDLLYATLLNGSLAADGDSVRITNAVRCVPPENKPETGEIRECNAFLQTELAALPNLRAVLSLGAISHSAVLTALGLRKSALPFRHGAQHALPGGLVLADSYHCSRYNTNTGRLTTAMFEAVVEALRPLVA